jgi:hypothetical protein
MAQYECRTLIVTQADVSFLSLHGCKEKIISIFTSDYLASAGVAYPAIRGMGFPGLLLTVALTRLLFLSTPIFVLFKNQKEYLQPLMGSIVGAFFYI